MPGRRYSFQGKAEGGGSLLTGITIVDSGKSPEGCTRMFHSGDRETEAQECKNLFSELVQCARLTTVVGLVGWFIEGIKSQNV